MKLTLTQDQEEKLHLLRLEGLKREMELHEAEEAYRKALEIEKAVSQYVVDHNEYYISRLDWDMPNMKNGDRVKKEFDICLIDEAVFMNDFLPKVKDAYMELYGIDNPLNFVYSYPMSMRRLNAEKAYRMIAVDFLRICGKDEEAQAMERKINGYLSPDIEERLLAIIEAFIKGN